MFWDKEMSHQERGRDGYEGNTMLSLYRNVLVETIIFYAKKVIKNKLYYESKV